MPPRRKPRNQLLEEIFEDEDTAQLDMRIPLRALLVRHFLDIDESDWLRNNIFYNSVFWRIFVIVCSFILYRIWNFYSYFKVSKFCSWFLYKGNSLIVIDSFDLLSFWVMSFVFWVLWDVWFNKIHVLNFIYSSISEYSKNQRSLNTNQDWYQFPGIPRIYAKG